MKSFLTLIFILCFGLSFGQTNLCESEEYIHFNPTAQLSFSNNGRKFNLKDLEEWKDQNRCDSIKSIYFFDFDTVPNEFARFRNVEKIIIDGNNIKRTNIELDNFPKLKELLIYENELVVCDSNKWLSRIEKMILIKSRIIGLKSFSQLKMITLLDMSFSGFDTIPNDFNKLARIKHLSLAGHMRGDIDLSDIDLTEMKELKYFRIICWRNLVKGLPKGLTKRICIQIDHDRLSTKEKKRLKRYSNT